MKKIAKYFTRIGLLISILTILSVLISLNTDHIIINFWWCVLVLLMLTYIVGYIVKESVIIDAQELKQEIKYKRDVFQYNRAIDYFMVDNMVEYEKLFNYITDDDLKYNLFLLYIGSQLSKGIDVSEDLEKLKYIL
jgi:hypothetical protein